MNQQQVFDTVIAHLRKQGVQAKQTNGHLGCAYRGQNGTKCAFGVLIPDHLYDYRMEGTCSSGVCMKYPEVGELFELELRPLIGDLQYLHDVHTKFEGFAFETDVQRTARVYCLTYTAPQGDTQ